MKENMTPTTTLLHGDCLELMKDIPDGSVEIKVLNGRVVVDQELWNKMNQNINYYL